MVVGSLIKDWCAAAMAVLILFGISALLHIDGTVVEKELLFWGIAPLVAFFGWTWWARLHGEPTAPAVPVAAGLAAGLLLYLASDAMTSVDFLYHFFCVHEEIGPDGRLLAKIHLPRVFGAICLGTAALSFVPALLPGTRLGSSRWNRVLWGLAAAALLVFASVYFANGLWSVTDGQELYRDDHPSFMQRLWIFPQTFPQILYWDPNWNAGRGITDGIQSYLVSSGSTAPGLLGYPFWSWGEANSSTMAVYTPAFIWLYLVVTPLVFVLAARVAGIGWAGSFVAGVLGLTATRYYFLWLLHFGTLGFCLSMPFLVLAAACLYRILYLDKDQGPRWWAGILLILAGFLYLCWPAGILMALGLPIAVLASWKRFTKRKLLLLGTCIAILWILMLPFLNAVLQHSKVGKLGGIEKEALPLLHLLREQLWRANPLLLAFGLVGVGFLSRRVLPERPGFRWFWGILISTTFVIFAAGGSLLPQFEFERMIIPLLFLAIIPTAAWFQALVDSPRARAAIPLAAMAVMLLAGVLHVRVFWVNQALECYRDKVLTDNFAADLNGTRLAYLDDFVDWSRDPATKDGRILIVNRAGAEFGRGHAAYLPIWCEREFVGCDFYDFPASLTELRSPPQYWQDLGPGGWMHYCLLYNIKYIVAYDNSGETADQLAGLNAFSKRFKKVFEFGLTRKFHIFEVLHDADPTWCRVGEAKVEAGINRIKVTLSDPTQSVLLRYRFAEGMTTDNPHVTVTSQAITTGFGPAQQHIDDFILVDPAPENTSNEVVITFKKWF